VLQLLRQELKYLHGLQLSVPSELRGWAWDRPPVRQRYRAGLGVSEVAYYSCCPREALEARLRGPRQDAAMLLGAAVHELFRRVAYGLQGLLGRGLEPWEAARRVMESRAYAEVASQFGLAGEAQRLRDLQGALAVLLAGDATLQRLLGGSAAGSWAPWLSEYVVDGTPLGLARRLRVDALMSGAVVEFKVGQARDWHAVQLAGYAMALESQLEVPFDYGLLVSVSLSPPSLSVHGLLLGEGPRSRFLEARDSMAEELASREVVAA
jgi:CRISPR-associated protein Csa1